MRHQTSAACFVLMALIATLGAALLARQKDQTVADGIYTDAQATRGAVAYDAACQRCHRADLGGADGPALKEDRFNRDFAGQHLQRLYERVAATMPKGAPASLSEGVYLDIIAHLLRENGFPPGPQELTTDGVARAVVLPTRPKPLAPVGEFSYVEVFGCLTQEKEGGWMLGPASEAVAVRTTIPISAPAPATAMPRDRARRYALIDAVAYETGPYRDHLVRVRGRLIGPAAEPRLAISTLESLDSTCR